MGHKKEKVFVLTAVTLILIGLVTGCARRGEPQNREMSASVVPKEDTTLIIFNWEDYLGESVVEAFEEETGIDVVEIFYVNEEEMLGAVQSGPGDYDLVVASDSAVSEMRQAKMLEELDYSMIENFKHIDRYFQRRAWDPEQKYSVPYLSGTLGLVINTKYVPDTTDSWGVLFDKAFAFYFTIPNHPAPRELVLNAAEM